MPTNGRRQCQDLVDDIPYKDAANGAGAAGAHSGGRIRFGPDRFLYVTTGDNHSAALPQDLRRLGGKVLRLNRDGTPAPGNGTPAGGDPRIFTYGHRNVQGISFRPAGQPQAGQPFTAEHGPNHSDEHCVGAVASRLGPPTRPGCDAPTILRLRRDPTRCLCPSRRFRKPSAEWSMTEAGRQGAACCSTATVARMARSPGSA